MGKGGAPTTTTTAQNQNVAYTPTGLQGFQNIYNQASQVASQPYQPYTGQLVQGLNPTQTGAIGNISQIASQPLTAGQIGQYMNPYQSDVTNATMANINETNQQQFADTTGKLQQAAGGIGASRIALGQGELARQQALASNQTLAGLNQQNYAQGLAAAQQQQGFGLGAAQAQLGAGTVQQQTGQAGLTAQYQQYLQALAFPYQQAQFLAGVGIPALGAMGGQQYQTGTANQTMTPPGMSWAQGIAGAGALGLGAYQGGLFNGGGGQSEQAVGEQGTPGFAARGGRIYPRHFAEGGGSDDSSDDSDPYHKIDVSPDGSTSHDDALAPVLSDKGYVPEESSAIKTPDNQIKPMAPIQTQSTPSQGGGGSFLGTLGTIAGAAAKIIPLLAASGGRIPHYDDGGSVPQQQGMGAPGANIYPTPSMLGSPLTRGALPQQAQMQNPNVFYGKPLPNLLPPHPITGAQANQNVYEMARQALQTQQLGQSLASIRNHAYRNNDDEGVSVSAQEYARGGQAIYPEHDAYSDMNAAWNKDRDRMEYGRDPLDRLLRSDHGDSVPIEPGTPEPDPQGLGRDVRQMASGGYAEGGDTEDPPMDLDSPDDKVKYRFPDDLPPAAVNPYDTAAGAVNRRFPSDMPTEATDSSRSPYASLAGTIRDNLGPAAPKGDKSTWTWPTPTSEQMQNAKTSLVQANDQLPHGPTIVPTITVRKPPTDSSDQSRVYPAGPPNDETAYRTPFNPGRASPDQIMSLDNYRDQVAQRPTVQGLTNNPDFWMRTGLNILAANPAKGPIGAIASGAAGTVGQYDQWSKDDLSSQEKARELASKLMEHAQKYTELTAADKARLQIEHEKLQQGHFQAVNYTDSEGRLNVGRFNTRTGDIVDSEGHPVNPSRLYGRSSRVDSKDISPQQMSIIIDRYRKNHPSANAMEDAQVRDLALQEINARRNESGAAQPVTDYPTVPKNKADLVKGNIYQTSKGPATWDGNNFVQ